jgi:hypothetical protein
MTAARPDGAAIMPALVVDDCWNRIGVRGDASCPELKRHVHCRNCPTHGDAASALLRRELPVAYRADWAGHFARRQEVEDPGTESAMIFRVGTEWLALPASVFQEVAELGAIHSLPHRRSSLVLGLTNVRGESLICFSLANLIGGDEAPQPKRDNRVPTGAACWSSSARGGAPPFRPTRCTASIAINPRSCRRCRRPSPRPRRATPGQCCRGREGRSGGSTKT